jgi:hypothetical protein
VAQAALELLDDLRGDATQLWLEGNSLRYRAAAGVLTEQRMSLMRELKADLVDLIQAGDNRTGAPPSILDAEAVWRPTIGQASMVRAQPRTLFDASWWLLPVDPARCEVALNEVVRRHSILRTRYLIDAADRLWAITEKERHIKVEQIDLTHLSEGEAEAEARRLTKELTSARFDVEGEPRLRFTFLRLTPADLVSVFVIDHSIFDGWSRRVFFGDLTDLYMAHQSGTAIQLPPLPLEFRDFARAQNDWQLSEAAHRDLLFWRDKLGEDLKPFLLPYDRHTPTSPSDSTLPPTIGKVDAASTSGLRRLVREEAGTMFACLVTAFGIVLRCWQECSEVFTWVVHSGRHRQELEGLIGMYSDCWLLRMSVGNQSSFRQTMRGAMAAITEAMPHMRTTPPAMFPLIKRACRGERPGAIMFNFVPVTASTSVIADTASGIEGSVGHRARPLDDWTGTPGRFEAGSPFAIHLMMFEGTESVTWEIQHNSELFEDATIERVSLYLARVLEAVAANPDVRVCDLLAGPAAQLAPNQRPRPEQQMRQSKGGES